MRSCDHEKLQILGFVIVALAFCSGALRKSPRASTMLATAAGKARPRGCSAERPYGMKRVACRKGA